MQSISCESSFLLLIRGFIVHNEFVTCYVKLEGESYCEQRGMVINDIKMVSYSISICLWFYVDITLNVLFILSSLPFDCISKLHFSEERIYRIELMDTRFIMFEKIMIIND